MLDRGHYRTALKIYHRLADSGDALAQDDLGYMYYLGLGTHQDFAKARKWFHRAADQAHSPAQFNLAVLYHRGQGVGKDRTNAYKWFDLWAVFATTVERRQLATGHQKRIAREMSVATARHNACIWWSTYRNRRSKAPPRYSGCTPIPVDVRLESPPSRANIAP
jgi:hypothetical protein